MLRANHAVRLGLRSASRNPELAFGKGLLDALGTALSALPWALAAMLVAAALDRSDAARALVAAARAAFSMRWAIAGGVLAAALLSWTLGMAFWSGALPVLAADAELGRRPPPGHFWPLALRGFPRVAAAGAVGYGLSLLFDLALVAGTVAALPAFLLRPGAGRLAALALLLSAGIVGGLLIELLVRLVLVRAAAFGDGATAAFAHAAALLARRLGACLVIVLAFGLLQLVVATLAGLFTGLAWTGFDPAAHIVAVPARLAVGLAFGVVFAWIEVARHGALAALAADAEGLIETPPEPPPPAPVPTVLERPEPVIEALPVIDALPAPPEDEEK